MSIKASKKVVMKYKKDDDLELHARRITITTYRDSHVYYDLREFVPSTKSYGKGVMVPEFIAKDLLREEVLK